MATKTMWMKTTRPVRHSEVLGSAEGPGWRLARHNSRERRALVELTSWLQDSFAVVNSVSDRGVALKITSDGRAGDGWLHWRRVEAGGKLVADLADSRHGATVTLAVRGSLRDGTTHSFPTLAAAAAFLLWSF